MKALLQRVYDAVVIRMKRLTQASAAIPEGANAEPIRNMRPAMDRFELEIAREDEAAARLGEARKEARRIGGIYDDAARTVIKLFYASPGILRDRMPEGLLDDEQPVRPEVIHQEFAKAYAGFPEAEFGLKLLASAQTAAGNVDKELASAGAAFEKASTRLHEAEVDVGAALDAAERFIRRNARRGSLAWKIAFSRRRPGGAKAEKEAANDSAAAATPTPLKEVA